MTRKPEGTCWLCGEPCPGRDDDPCLMHPGCATAYNAGLADGAAQVIRCSACTCTVEAHGDEDGEGITCPHHCTGYFYSAEPHDSIVCQDYPDCDREHAGGAGGVPVHPPAGSRVSGDEALIPDSAPAPAGKAEALREVVGALTHDFCGGDDWLGLCLWDHPTDAWSCNAPRENPVHRTVAVIQAALTPDDTSTPGVPATTEGRQQ